MLNIKNGQSLENSIRYIRSHLSIVIFTVRYRDKVIMKELCGQHGIKIPIYAPVESSSDVISFTAQHGFPVVVKPKMGTLFYEVTYNY
jgi:phosphoribosylaminoimidazole carboxylase (NCAIR synthetase)